MLAAFASMAGMAGGGGSSSFNGGAHSTESGGAFSGGTLGGINFGQYKSTDQNTIMLVVGIVFVALVIMGKK